MTHDASYCRNILIPRLSEHKWELGEVDSPALAPSYHVIEVNEYIPPLVVTAA